MRDKQFQLIGQLWHVERTCDQDTMMNWIKDKMNGMMTRKESAIARQLLPPTGNDHYLHCADVSAIIRLAQYRVR